MWPFVLLGGAAVAVLAFMAGRKKEQEVRRPSPAGSQRAAVETMREAMVAPTAPAPAAPRPEAPVPTTDSATLAGSAEVAAAHLRKEGRNYNPIVVSDFQRLAGLTADGVYGRRTRAALIRAGVAPELAPAPLGTSRRA